MIARQNDGVFSGKRQRCVTEDTDSLCYEVKTEDFYKDINDDVQEWFDTTQFFQQIILQEFQDSIKKFQE